MPHVELLLAGRNMPESWTSDAHLGIRILGEVERAEDTYDTPVLWSSLSTRARHADQTRRALASGRPVITTSKGMEGLDLTHEEHVIVANNTEDMQAALMRVLRTTPLR